MEYNPVGKGDKLQRPADLFNLAEAGRLWLPDVGEEAGFPRGDVVSELVVPSAVRKDIVTGWS